MTVGELLKKLDGVPDYFEVEIELECCHCSVISNESVCDVEVCNDSHYVTITEII